MADKTFVTPRRLKRFLTNLRGEKLNTKEEILANTDAKKFAGAMAVQEMFNDVTDSLGGYALTTKDGKIAYYKVSEGADSAVPFISSTSEKAYVDCILGTENPQYQYNATYTVPVAGTYTFECFSTAINSNTNQTLNGTTIPNVTKISDKGVSSYYSTIVRFTLTCDAGDVVCFNTLNNGGYCYDCCMMVFKYDTQPTFLDKYLFAGSNYIGAVNYTVPENGHYYFSAHTTSWQQNIKIEINGKLYKTQHMNIEHTGHYNNCSVYFDLECFAGDTIKIYNNSMYTGGVFISREN